MKRNVLNSPRLLELKKHRHRAFLNKILILLLGLVVIFALSAYVSHLSSLNIKGIEISGNKIVDTEMIRTTVQEQIAGKYLWLFPKTNILYYPQNKIKNELHDKFNRIKDINLSVQDNKILLVSVTERGAKYIWCGISLPQEASDNQKCNFMDENGYIFDEAPYFSGEVYFKFYGLTSESYFSKSNFKQLISFKDTLIGLGLQPVALYAADGGDMQIFLSGGTPLTAGPKIMFRADANLENVAENLQAALSTEPLQSKFKNEYSKLQYIDLRFGNKVYDKFE